MKNELRQLFYEWLMDKYAEDLQGKDESIRFVEKNYDKILEDFGEEVEL
jgi:hypothetical protein